jgi:putative ABC transport system ATP-binding protein
MLLQAHDLVYRYAAGSAGAAALDGASLEVQAGEQVAIVGPSGSGKTTLLYCLAGIVVPTEGEVRLDGQGLSGRSDAERARVRLERFGFVFQFAELVAELTLRENVELPVRLLGHSARQCRQRAEALMGRLGIGELADRLPAQVSGGQAQRCAVARALVHGPAVVLADEPTGSLDRATGRTTLSELLGVCAEADAALIVVTHDEAIADQLDRRIHVADGRCFQNAPSGGAM